MIHAYGLDCRALVAMSRLSIPYQSLIDDEMSGVFTTQSRA
jgi:hypothetical protein